ncbi:hypothetical protein CYMTET_30221 [Cymbomonas tetramitiformis]|uniref:NYN domain-containing protein n=1 Tax=Cymbomonas tetramitiformis TaxID=36881 RepID=A0AAE0FJG4_9CHLO|nr:hypothetical protein CYMTET_30221 [Cymbomonas tetramitiformis]
MRLWPAACTSAMRLWPAACARSCWKVMEGLILSCAAPFQDEKAFALRARAKKVVCLGERHPYRPMGRKRGKRSQDSRKLKTFIKRHGYKPDVPVAQAILEIYGGDVDVDRGAQPCTHAAITCHESERDVPVEGQEDEPQAEGVQGSSPVTHTHTRQAFDGSCDVAASAAPSSERSIQHEQPTRAVEEVAGECFEAFGTQGVSALSEVLSSALQQMKQGSTGQEQQQGSDGQLVHIFVDNSNIVFQRRNLDIPELMKYVEGGRTVMERQVTGSRSSLKLWEHEWTRINYDVICEGGRGKEQFVDEFLHSQIWRVASKVFFPKRVLAILTGDGNDNQGRGSFPECIAAALRNGWFVEVYSWRISTHHVYKDKSFIEPQHQHRFSLKYLDCV